VADLLEQVTALRRLADGEAKASQDQMHAETVAGSHVHALRVAIADAARLAGEHDSLAKHHQRLHELHLKLYDQLRRLEQP